MKLFRDPFVQFLLSGIAIYILFAFTATEDPVQRDHRITLDAPTLEWIHGNFTKQFRRPPTPAEMDTLVQTHIEHEVKYREALTIGLDERDTIVQRRLIQKFDFLFGDAAAQMEPDDAVLQAWYDNHSGDYETPETITFTHHWFSPDSRNARARQDAEAAVATLNAGESSNADRFPFDNSYTAARRAEVRSVFGQDFAMTIFEAPLNSWVGPIESGLGYHAVRITARTRNTVPPMAGVREDVLQEWRREESQRILERTLTELLDDYTVTIDEGSLNALEFSAEAQ